jgi:tetratricopeptide (TPR) repeat protein
LWSETPEKTRKRWIVIALVGAIAFAAKLLLAFRTYGTNDVYTYERFALWSRYFGAELYKIAPDLNHPPSMLHILSGMLWMSDHTQLPFHFWLRFPGILADAGTLWLICRILGPRIAQRSVFIAVLLIAIAPIHILISGFHGNTDPIMIFFVMAAVWLAGYRDKPIAGGAAYGLALCIKVAPAMLVPVLFLSLAGMRKRAAFFLATACVVMVAWSPYIFQQPAAVIHQVFGYKSSYGLWGFSWLFRELANAWPASQSINNGFSRFGSVLVVAAILILSLWMNRLERKPWLYAQVGMVFLLFFTATSGFAVQYLAWLTPWIAELGALPVALFMLTGSVFLLVVYNYWNLGMPWYLAIAYPWSSHQYFQVLCWISALLLSFAAWRRIQSGHAFAFPSPRIPMPLRLTGAAAAIALFLIYPAIVHIRRDWLGRQPSYDVDEVLFIQADEYHDLASALLQRGRVTEAYEVEDHAKQMDTRAQRVADSLTQLQPARLVLRTPEDYVDTSRRDYDEGNYEQCIVDAKESLKLRPGMPAAWYNISICSAQLADWDAAVAAATEAMRIEPESDIARENLDWIIAQRQLAASSSR